MKKSSFLALVALFVAATGVIIALAAYFKRRDDCLYDDDDFLFDDPEDLEYYSSDFEDDGAEGESGGGEDTGVSQF